MAVLRHGPYQGLNVIWYMNGTVFLSEELISTVSDTNWRIAGTGDFNRDGNTDILWRYYGDGSDTRVGRRLVYERDGTIGRSRSSSTVSDTNWRIAGTGDFNGDGNTDILWRYYGTGGLQGMDIIWYMDGANFGNQAQVLLTCRHGHLNWEIAGIGDFNGDRNRRHPVAVLRPWPVPGAGC